MPLRNDVNIDPEKAGANGLVVSPGGFCPKYGPVSFGNSFCRDNRPVAKTCKHKMKSCFFILYFI
jgi:2-phospho-L-lactate guanylyltransferase (CobY/MobA/RfbA family)